MAYTEDTRQSGDHSSHDTNSSRLILRQQYRRSERHPSASRPVSGHGNYRPGV